MLKRLREKSYETTDWMKNVVPLNLAEKSSAEPPFRRVVNGKPLNEAYETWRVKYEGIHTVPLTVKQDDW